MTKNSNGKKKETLDGGLILLNGKSAGADLGSREHYVTVTPSLLGEGEPNCRRFGTCTDELEELGKWLCGLGVESIAMEATGVYWIGLYEILEKYGIEVYLVNSRHLKNVKGRKSDVGDSNWLQTLHSYGLLRASFIPEEAIRDLKAVRRHRRNIEEERSRAILRIQKALEMMNVKIHHFIRDIVGVTGMKLLRAMVSGQTDASKLAELHNKRMKASREDWERALRGNYKEAHVFCLGQALAKYDFCMQQMEECDGLIERKLMLLAEGVMVGLDEPMETKARKKKAKTTIALM